MDAPFWALDSDQRQRARAVTATGLRSPNCQTAGATGPSTPLDDPINADNKQLFFAKIIRSATDDDVRRLFARYGRVIDVNLFRAFQGAPTTKGCGLVTMASHEEAVAAIAALDQQFVWEGMETPMVVKWMDMALQRRRRELHLANMRQALSPGGLGFGGSGLSLATTLPVPAVLGLGQGLGQGLGVGLDSSSFLDALEPTETPPPGCAPDAIKLFVGNVPKTCSEEQLLPLFQSVGKVVELVIVHDKVTHESKGSAFVWYATRNDAERAIIQFNLRHMLSDPSGDQDRPLVVRRAKMRAKPVKQAPMQLGALGGLSQVQLHGLAGMGGPTSRPPSGQPQPMYKPAALERMDRLQLGGALGVADPGSLVGAGLGSLVSQGSGGLEHLGLSAAASNGVPYRSLSGGFVALGGVQRCMYDALAGNEDLQLLELQQQVAAAALSSPLDRLPGMPNVGLHMGVRGPLPGAQPPPITLSLTLNQSQLAVLNQHLFSVQAVSGAALNVSPGAPGLFNVFITGRKPEVDSARNLVSTILTHA